MALSRLCTRRLLSSLTAAATTTTSTSFSIARISSFSSSNFSFLTNPAAESSTNYSNGSYPSQLREPTRFPTNFILDVSRRLSTSSGPLPAKPNNPADPNSPPHGDRGEEPNSSNPPEKDTEAQPAAAADPFASFKHQEIEGPTVERDLSPLANETREVLARLRRSLYDLSRGIALLGIAQLVCGSWIASIARAGENAAAALPMEVTVQSVVAFAFPFATAFLLRQAVKPMAFFAKMEGLGRLQILTLCLQVVKGVDQTVRRVRIVSVFSAAGLLIALSAVIWSK